MVPVRTARAGLLVLALLALALLLVIALPFATTLFVAAVLAGALAPWRDRLTAALRGRRRLACGLLTGGVLLGVVGPASGFAAVLVPQVVAGVSWLRSALSSDALAGLVRRVPEVLRPAAERLHDALPSSLERLQELVGAESGRAAAVVGNVLTATGSFLFHVFLMLIALYFLLLDGPALVAWVNRAAPLKRGQVSELLRDFRNVTVVVLVSTVATAAVQSALAFGGYLVAGVPSPLFFALATFVVALIPAVGATVMVVAVGLVQLAIGHTGWGIFLLAWGLGVVGTMDNVLRPLFIRGGVPIHGGVIFFALLGGVAAFGPVGFLVGPLAVTFLVAVVRMYRRDYVR